jgi:hypothetical protein
VVPNYIVTTLDTLVVNGNSEDDSSNPAELSFSYIGLSGSEPTDTAVVPLIKRSGSFPGGAAGSAHLTNADHTVSHPRLPLFVGAEAVMNKDECDEEAAALRRDRSEAQTRTCEDYANGGRFNDQFEIAFAGAELDVGASKWYGVVAGLAATGAACYLTSSCSSGASLGVAVGKAVNEALGDDGDPQGVVGLTFHRTPAAPFWDLSHAGPYKMAGEGKDLASGDIDIHVSTRRMGAPRIKEFRVNLKSIKVLQGYEEGICLEPNEVFLEARAFMPSAGSLAPASTHYPRGGGTWSIATGKTMRFGGTGESIAWVIHPVAIESPVLYVEIGVWENDKQKDLMGLHSQSIYLEEFVANAGADEGTDQGDIRTVNYTFSRTVHGYAGSDNHCHTSVPQGWKPSAEEGKVTLEYDVYVKWLKVMD